MLFAALRPAARGSRRAARALSTAARAAPPSHIVPDELIDANGGLLEYSVVYTDRAMNHMSAPFGVMMRELHEGLCAVYNAEHAVLIPGSGTYGMEAVARQFGGPGRKCVAIRNGYFSYRWSQVYEQCLGMPEGQNPLAPGEGCHGVIRARPVEVESAARNPYAPPPLEEVRAMIHRERPALVCAPHVETSLGILLPDDYVRGVAEAVRDVDGVFCLDGIASGTAWVDMGELGVDCYLTAPQKGWTGPACCGIVMLSERARAKMAAGPRSTSFSIDLKKWHELMGTYLDGGFAYHTTMPTDALARFHRVFHETMEYGFQRSKDDAFRLGAGVRAAFAARGFDSVAAKGFEAPGVVVVYADDAKYAARFREAGVQIAAGVPWLLGEPESNPTFRIGLFGLDKMRNVDQTLAKFEEKFDQVIAMP